MLPISHWPAAELRPLGGPPCAVARSPVVWGIVPSRAPPCAGLVRVAPPRAASRAGKCPPHPESAVVSAVEFVVDRVATPLASLILLLPLTYSCPHNSMIRMRRIRKNACIMYYYIIPYLRVCFMFLFFVSKFVPTRYSDSHSHSLYCTGYRVIIIFPSSSRRLRSSLFTCRCPGA